MTFKQTLVRCSALSSYPDCPRRGAARLFQDEIEAAGYALRRTGSGIGASIGTSVHAGAAMTLTEKMLTGRLAPLDAVTDCAVEAFRTETAAGVAYDAETTSAHDAEQQIVKMVRAYQAVIAPAIEPITVEEQLEAETDFGIILTGKSDLLARDDGGLRDLKTGKRQSHHRPQIGGYSLLIQANGLPVTSAHVDFIQRVPVKKPQPEPVTDDYDLAGSEKAALSVLRHIAADIDAFRNGSEELGIEPGDAWAFTANPSSMLCSDKYCAAYGTDFCHEHRKKDQA
jgi:hypothetical protein